MTLEQEIITWLEQSVNLQIHDAPGRKALLIGAGLSDMQNAVNFEGATLVFCRNVVEYLWNYGQLTDGRDPLIALLETAQTLVGTDKRAQCAALVARLRDEERQPVVNQILPPTDANTLAGSSLRIGQARDVTIHQGDHYGVPPELFAEYVKKLALTEDTVKRFFEILKQEQVPREEWDRKFQEIAAQYKELLERLEVIQSEDAEVVRLKTEARQAIEDGKFDDAERSLEQAEKRDLAAVQQLQTVLEKRRLSAAKTRADNAQLQSIRLRYKKAADYFLQAAQILPEGHEEKRAICLSAAGENLYCISKYTEVLSLFEESLTIYRRTGDLKEVSRVLDNIGLIYDAWNNYTTALTYLEESLAIRKKIGDKSGEGKSLSNISQIYKAYGDYITALTYLEQSLSIRQELNDKYGEGSILNNMGSIYVELRQDEKALSVFEKGLKIFCEIGDKIGEAAILCNISRVFKVRKDYTKALAYLERSLKIERTLSNKFGEARVLGNIGKIYLVQGEDIITASVYLKQSLAIQNEIGDKSGKGTTLSDLGMSAHVQGDDITALMYFKQGLAIFHETGNKPEDGTICWNIGQIYANQGDFVSAEEYIRRSVEIAKETCHPNLEKRQSALQEIQQALKLQQVPCAFAAAASRQGRPRIARRFIGGRFIGGRNGGEDIGEIHRESGGVAPRSYSRTSLSGRRRGIAVRHLQGV